MTDAVAKTQSINQSINQSYLGSEKILEIAEAAIGANRQLSLQQITFYTPLMSDVLYLLCYRQKFSFNLQRI